MFILVAKMIGTVSKFAPLINVIDENSHEFTKIYDAPNNESYIAFENYKFANIKSVKCVYYTPQTNETNEFKESRSLCAMHFKRTAELTLNVNNPFESNEIPLDMGVMFECKISNKYFFVLRYKLNLKYRNFNAYHKLAPILTNESLAYDFLSCNCNILQFLIQTNNNKIFYEIFSLCEDIGINIKSLLIKAIMFKNIEIIDFILQQKELTFVRFWDEVIIAIMETQDIALFKKYIDHHVKRDIVIMEPTHVRELLFSNQECFQ